MRIIITKDFEELGKVATQHLLGVMFGKQDRVNLAITGGRTPATTYQQLIQEVKRKDYLSHVHYYNFDELPYKVSQKPGLTIGELQKIYFEPAEIAATNIHPLDEKNYRTHDAALSAVGGLDAILMGIGADGHFCGNMPGTTTFDDMTTRVDFTPESKAEVAAMYGGIEEVPDYYVTMGPRSVMAAKQLILIANGTEKAEIMKRVLEGKIDQNIPSSILTMHPNLTVIMDQEAASLLS